MKLVLAFNAGDGCTYSCDVRLPIEHISAEHAREEFDQLAHAAYEAGRKDYSKYLFTFAGHRLDSTDFHIEHQYFPPDIWTIDEWFAVEANPNHG